MFPFYIIKLKTMNQAPIKIMQLTPTSITVFNEYQHRNFRTTEEIENETNLTRGNYNGSMSMKTKRRITKRLNSWLQSLVLINKIGKSRKIKTSRKPTFITLTLPSTQQHTDKTIKRHCLIPFIEKMKKSYSVKHYFWVAETQKNGNIHFHVIIDSFIHHSDVRANWNSNLAKLGYIESFRKNHGHTNPNSTDIHVLGGFDTAIKYVVKYVQKSHNARPIDGRLHGISDGLKNLKPFTTVLDESTHDFIDQSINQESSKVFIDDHFLVIYCKVMELECFKNLPIAKEFDNYLIDTYECLYLDKESFNLRIQNDLTTMIIPEVLEKSIDLDAELMNISFICIDQLNIPF